MQLLPAFTSFLLLTILIEAQFTCNHDENLERIRRLEQQKGFSISNRIRTTRSELADWSPIRVQIYSSYILNDIENRTCYTTGQVCCLRFI
jgi:hypothetical protein